MDLRQSEDDVKQKQSAFTTSFWFAVMPQLFDRLLKLKANDIHKGLNDPLHFIADQIFQILARKTHGFTESILFPGIRIIRPLLGQRQVERRSDVCCP